MKIRQHFPLQHCQVGSVAMLASRAAPRSIYTWRGWVRGLIPVSAPRDGGTVVGCSKATLTDSISGFGRSRAPGLPFINYWITVSGFGRSQAPGYLNYGGWLGPSWTTGGSAGRLAAPHRSSTAAPGSGPKRGAGTRTAASPPGSGPKQGAGTRTGLQPQACIYSREGEEHRHPHPHQHPEQ